jgi:CheY-like chemotaxis protein
MVARPPGSASVMVVDDDADVRDLLSQFLEVEGFEVSSARNGEEAIEQLRNGRRASVILLDLMMPVMNGWQFRDQQMRDPGLAGIPVIVISAVTAHAQPIAADAHLSKPIDLDQLLDTIRMLAATV